MSVTGIVLAAGLSRRMGAANKLTMEWRGKPLVRHVVDAAMASGLDDVLVVLGHEAEAVRATLPNEVATVVAGDHEDGLSATLKAGLRATSGDVMVLLGDMPLVTASHINALLDAFDDENPLVVATDEGRLGNPVLFAGSYRDKLLALEGDRGARAIIDGEPVATIEIGPAASRDFDTAEAFRAG